MSDLLLLENSLICSVTNTFSLGLTGTFWQRLKSCLYLASVSMTHNGNCLWRMIPPWILHLLSGKITVAFWCLITKNPPLPCSHWPKKRLLLVLLNVEAVLDHASRTTSGQRFGELHLYPFVFFLWLSTPKGLTHLLSHIPIEPVKGLLV